MVAKPRDESDLSKMISPLLEEVAKNNTIREEIIADPLNANNTVMNFLRFRIKQPNIVYAVRICEIEDICGLSSYPTSISGNIYAGSRVISSGLIGGAQPKRVSIFLWIEG